MQLFYTKSSPFALCVRVVVSELELAEKMELIESHPFDNHPDFLAANPMGRVPCLLGDGESIIDSEVICDFLDASFTGGSLFNAIYADWRLKSLYSMCSELMNVSVSRRIEFIRDQDGIKSDFWWQRQTQAIERTLTYIANKLTLFPEDFSILHVNLMSGLAYLDFRHQDIDWRTLEPALSNFYDLWKERQCFKDNSLSD